LQLEANYKKTAVKILTNLSVVEGATRSAADVTLTTIWQLNASRNTADGT
jgi:hypothetical protein